MKPPYKIEKGVPLRTAPSREWLTVMEVGDSFLLPPEDANNSTLTQSMHSWAAQQRPEPWKFVTRREGKSRRVWRKQ